MQMQTINRDSASRFRASATDRWPAGRGRAAATFLLACFMLWVVVDFGTAGGFRPTYLATYMPALLVFYLGYPAVFTYLIFRRGTSTRGLVLATVVAIFIVEVLFAHNPWLVVPPLLFVGIPLAIAIYAPLTFFPLWLARGELDRHRRLVRGMCAVEAVIIALSTLGKGG